MPKLLLKSWTPGLKTISLIKIVREAERTSLVDAKEKVEQFIEGSPVVVDVKSNEPVSQIVKSISDLGVDVVETT